MRAPGGPLPVRRRGGEIIAAKSCRSNCPSLTGHTGESGSAGSLHHPIDRFLGADSLERELTYEFRLHAAQAREFRRGQGRAFRVLANRLDRRVQFEGGPMTVKSSRVLPPMFPYIT